MDKFGSQQTAFHRSATGRNRCLVQSSRSEFVAIHTRQHTPIQNEKIDKSPIKGRRVVRNSIPEVELVHDFAKWYLGAKIPKLQSSYEALQSKTENVN